MRLLTSEGWVRSQASMLSSRNLVLTARSTMARCCVETASEPPRSWGQLLPPLRQGLAQGCPLVNNATSQPSDCLPFRRVNPRALRS